MKWSIPTGPMAGLWMIAAFALIAIVAGASERSEGGNTTGIAAVCFTLATGFLAVAEAISGRKSS